MGKGSVITEAGPWADYTAPEQFDTELTRAEEDRFKDWKAKYAPRDSGEDYDLRGAFKAGLTPAANGHWPDTFKKPNHPTFSVESIYAKDAPERAGHWEGEKFVRAAAEEGPWKDYSATANAEQGPWKDFQTEKRPPWEDYGTSEARDTNPDAYNAELRAAPERSVWQRTKRAVREGLTPLIGPDEEQLLRDGVVTTGPDGQPTLAYRPMGGRVESEGFFPALSHPMVPIPKIPQQKGKLAQTGAGLANTAIGFLEFAESPLGLATGGAGGMGLARPVAGAYAADMALKTPEAARQFGEATVNGTLQEQVEKGAGLGAQIVLPAVLGGKAIAGGRRVTQLERPKAEPTSVGATAPAARNLEEALQRVDDGVQTSALSAEKFLEQEPVSQLRQGQFPTVEVPLKELRLSKEVPNFKADADAETGVVEGQELEGKYERLGTGAITVWERKDGTREVVSGRHRFDLARRTGEKTIPAQVIREADGWTKEDVATLDAEMNIRDGQGTVGDYANYFRGKSMTEEEADARGLLARAKGQAGWALGKMATDDLYALYRGGKVKEEQAVAIATAAPASAGPQEASLQRVGSKAALNGMGPQELRNFIQAVRLKTKALPAEQLDLFGSDDAAMNEAQKLAKVATELQRELDREIKSTDNAARNAAGAAKKGIKFERDPQEILRENALLRLKRNEWDNWALKPELVGRVLERAGVRGQESGDRSQGTPGADEVNAPKDRVEAALDALKIETGGPGAQLEGVTGLPVLVWNGSLEVVRAAYRAGKTIVEAAKAGLEWIRANHPDAKFDEEEYVNAVTSEKVMGERQFPKKVDISEDVSDAVKEGTGVRGQESGDSTRFYEPRRNETDAEWAGRTIEEQGISGAIRTVKMDNNGLAGAQRTALGLALIKRLGLEERAAEGRGDRAAANEAIDAAVDLVDHVARRGTDIAQSLQAFSMWGRMTPAGHLRAARRTIDEAGRTALQGLKPALEGVRGALERGNAEAADGVAREAAAREDARPPIEEAIAKSKETHTAVVVEVAGKLGESPEILRQIRERVRGIVERDEREALERKLKNLLGEHYAEVISNQKGASNQVRPLVEKLKAAGVKNPEQLAKAADREVKQRVEAEKAKLAGRVKAARVDKPLGMLSKESAIDAAIRKQLKTAGLKLDTIVRWHFTRADGTGKSLAQRLTEHLGLSPDGAAYLAARIEARFKALAGERKRALLARLGTMTKARVLSRPGLQQRLVEMSNLGAFDDAKFYNAVKEKLGLPVFTQEMGREITRRANRLQEMPEGFQQQRGVIELMNYVARQKGVKWYELPMAFWYANVLSGPATHLVNVVSNVFNLGANTMLEIAKRPDATPQILQALGRGVLKGRLEAADALKTGTVTGTRAGKVETGRALELKQFTGWATPLNAWKYVARAMAAEDLVFYKAAEEMKMAVAARVLAKSEGITDRAQLIQRTAEILGQTDAARSAAEIQAEREGLKGLDYRRRVLEIVEQSRPNSIREDARQFGLRTTFNNRPYGLLGVIAEAVNWATRKAPILKIVAPFVNIVANVTNVSMDYSLIGAARGIAGLWDLSGRTFFGKRAQLEGRPVTGEAVVDHFAKAAVGTAALAGVAMLAAKYLGQANPAFAVNGAGPRTPDQKRQLRETGWIPYSFKIGNRYVSYQQTPMMIPMAILGNYLDALKYKRLDETDNFNRVVYAWQISGGVITEQSFLSGISGVLQSFTEDHSKSAGEMFASAGARQAAGFAIPNALKQIDQIFDPTVYDARTIETALINQVPFARSLNKPAINVLGDSVEKYLSGRFESEEREAALWKVLAAKQAWVPVPSRETIVGSKKDGPGEFRVMTPSEVYAYTRISGRAIKERLMDDLMDLATMRPDEAKDHVQKVTEEERKKAKEMFR